MIDRNEFKCSSLNAPKSLKQDDPISIDVNDSQFNMWTDFDASHSTLIIVSLNAFLLIVVSVNELLPIIRLFSLFNPFNSNDFTWRKQFWPILIDSSEIKFDKLILLEFTKVESFNSIDLRFGRSIQSTNNTINTLNNQ